MHVSTPSATPEDPSVDVFEFSDRTPLQALAGAYADRLVLIRSHADAADLADNTALIASLERLCMRQEG
jgi:hypothetical protein